MDFDCAAESVYAVGSWEEVGGGGAQLPNIRIKGKSTMHVARVYGERKRNFVGQHFWARGYFVLVTPLLVKQGV